MNRDGRGEINHQGTKILRKTKNQPRINTDEHRWEGGRSTTKAPRHSERRKINHGLTQMNTDGRREDQPPRHQDTKKDEKSTTD
jgi:hypothetical protein